MTLNANDQPILVAPRPVRLSSVFVSRSPFAHERNKSNDLSPTHDFHLALVSTESGPDGGDHHQLSRPLSRSNLPTEALEEFLSILKPSFFPPPSPSFRSRIRQPLSPLPIQSNTRRLLTIPSPSKKEAPEDSENIPSRQPSRNGQCITPETAAELDELADRLSENMTFRWYKGSLLSSPISRTHTRNPFLRQPINRPPSSASRAPTPCSIPLPLPTPDELLDIPSD